MDNSFCMKTFSVIHIKDKRNLFSEVIRVFLVPTLLFILNGCYQCPGKNIPVEPKEPVQLTEKVPPVDSQPTPPTTPSVQTPTTPLQQPLSADEHTPSGKDLEQTPEEFSASKIYEIKPGMTYRDVVTLLNHPGILIANMRDGTLVYRWNISGITFMGRFENGVLARKNFSALGTGAPPEESKQGLITRSLIDTLQPGMTLEQVNQIIGTTPQLLTASDDKITLYRWSDEQGSSITARFEDGVLSRKSWKIAETTEEGSKEEDEGSPPTLAQKAPGQMDQDDYEPSRTSTESEAPVLEEPSIMEMPRQTSRVHIVGSERRERELASNSSPNAGRSYRPTVKLPEFKRRLRSGAYEIRFYNRTNSRIRVAIISDEGGLDLSVPANSRTAARVNRGMYMFYFINDADPYTLYEGQEIPVEELLTDFAVFLYDNASEVIPI